MTLDLAIILLHWNSYEDTKQCLESICKNQNISIHVIFVDNGSGDNSVSKLKKQFQDLEMIDLPENIGFAAGNNVGIKAALKKNPEAILLVNNDTILKKDCLNQMYSCLMEDNQTGAVVPKIFYQHDPELIWYAGGKMNWWKISVQHYGFRKTNESHFNDRKTVSFATGCALMLKTEAIKTVGLLDEKFFSYFEDLDYSIRLKSSGYKIQYCPKALLWHKVGAGTNSETYSPFYLYYQTRNRIYLCRKYKKLPVMVYVHLVNFFVYFLLRILLICFGTPKGIKMVQIKSVFTGYKDSWMNKFGPNKRWEAT